MFKKMSVWLALLIMLVVNTLAVVLPINNISTKELSDAIPIYFVPAGYVFSIWSIIYIALIVYAVYQTLPRNTTNSVLHSIAWLFVVNALANSGWILLWHYHYVATSVVLMLIILGTLLAIYSRLSIGQKPVTAITYWCSHFPFSLYLGWISVATIANISGALYVHHWSGWGISGPVWAAIMIIVAAVLAITMLWRRRDYVYAAVIVWALIGIAVKFPEVLVIWWSCSIAVVAIGAGVVVTIFRKVSKPFIQ